MILILVTFVKGKNMMVKENNMTRTLERLSLLRKKMKFLFFDNFNNYFKNQTGLINSIGKWTIYWFDKN